MEMLISMSQNNTQRENPLYKIWPYSHKISGQICLNFVPVILTQNLTAKKEFVEAKLFYREYFHAYPEQKIKTYGNPETLPSTTFFIKCDAKTSEGRNSTS